MLHETALANRRDTPLGVSEEEDARVRADLIKALQKLQGTVSSKPSSFYALLLMDGDSMGQLLSEARQESGDVGEQSVTQALGKFAEAVPQTVSKHDGVTVYCGGDDVLAMLPVDSALRCAWSLSNVHETSFAETCPKFSEKATISAAIVFCPFRAPFREVIELAHHLLDHVAKDATGRDSLAVAVLKSGGVTCQTAEVDFTVTPHRKSRYLCRRLVAQCLGLADRRSERVTRFSGIELVNGRHAGDGVVPELRTACSRPTFLCW